MAATVDDRKVTLAQQLVDLGLATAWLRRCGTEDQPGEWFIPGEFISLGEIGDVEIDAYPTYASINDANTVTGWSFHLDPASPTTRQAWEFRANVGWEDLSTDETDRLEELGGCVDDRQVSFMILGSHQQRPSVPDHLYEAVALLGWPNAH